MPKSNIDAEEILTENPTPLADNTAANFVVLAQIAEKTIQAEREADYEPNDHELAVAIAWNIARSLPSPYLLPGTKKMKAFDLKNERL